MKSYSQKQTNETRIPKGADGRSMSRNFTEKSGSKSSHVQAHRGRWEILEPTNKFKGMSESTEVLEPVNIPGYKVRG